MSLPNELAILLVPPRAISGRGSIAGFCPAIEPSPEPAPPTERECDCDWKEELQFAGIDFVPCTCERHLLPINWIENNEPL